MQSQTYNPTTTLSQAAPQSTSMRWLGRTLSALPAVFLLLDGAVKLLNLPPVVEASQQLGIPPALVPAIGILLLVCLGIHLLPRTSVLGAILLTGYLGGAVAVHMCAGSASFSLIFPILIGALLWGGLFLRNAQLRNVLLGHS
jgi:hypothetical protein